MQKFNVLTKISRSERLSTKRHRYALSVMITVITFFSEMNCINISYILHVFSDTLKSYLREELHLVE